MKKWIKNTGIFLLALGIMLMLTSDFNLNVEAEKGAFYITMFIIIIGGLIEIYGIYEDRKKGLSWKEALLKN